MFTQWTGAFIFAILLVVVGVILLTLVVASIAWWLGLLGHAIQRSLEYGDHTRTRPPIPPALRRAVLERDGHRCVVCSSDQDLELDHEIPFSRGGATTFDNLRVLCHDCNQAKGAN